MNAIVTETRSSGTPSGSMTLVFLDDYRAALHDAMEMDRQLTTNLADQKRLLAEARFLDLLS